MDTRTSLRIRLAFVIIPIKTNAMSSKRRTLSALVFLINLEHHYFQK